jgi:hypothetical protein
MTTPGDAFDVDTDQLVRHAGGVEQLASRADQATAAMQHVRLDAAAYGQLCAFVPALLGPVQLRLEDGARESATALHTTAVNLRSAAAEYREGDTAAAERIISAGRPQVRR